MSDDYQDTIDMILEAATFGELNTAMKDLHMKTRPLSAAVLVDLVVARAIGEELRDQLRRGGTKALVVEVPDGGWAEPIGDAIKSLIGDLAYVIARSSIPRGNDLNDGMLPKKLREGRVAVGVAAQPDRTLPPLLLSLAEVRVAVVAPDAEMIIEVIRKSQGGRIPKEASTLMPEMLSFDEITALIDRNGNAVETVRRIRAAIERKTGTNGSRNDSRPLPRLEDAIEYGDARTWALSLRDDIADMRKGLIGWEDIDRGCVLHGPPGTGKTLLARMLGEACGVPVVVSSIAELFANSSGYLNDVIKALRKTFDEARAKAPSILFLDEINALPNIDTVGDRNKDYWAPVIFDFYTLLDGAMSVRDGVIVIGATNRIEDIHPALLRPGRLERAIHVGAPDAAGVERIMRHHLGGDLADGDLENLAIQNVARGATGAVVMEQVRAARRLARRAGRPMVLADLEAQIVEEETRTPEELRRSAIHESGHVIAGLAVGSTLDIVSIAMSGGNGGCARLSMPTGTLVTRHQLEGVVMSLLGGRAAEQLLMGEPSQGAGGATDSDLARSTGMVASMEASLGLGHSLLFRALPEDAWQLLREPDFRRRVEKLLDELYQRTIDILHARRPALEAVVEALLKRRFLTGEEVESIIESSESVVENRESMPAQGGQRQPVATG
ncbi:AAA family ATPase [Devosia sp. ZB163]|uniref:AAA family ATPase n=1 Tax=Devosia sp. ZB163 TaxID=3025938 RepID=UPI002361B57E|nr:AAA family ATPase [Devosia sp. ZB163]MDC9824842.1 AAA family ATPase [Devosia sp. ZB163]